MAPFEVPLNENSIAGSCVFHKKTVNLPNAYQDSRFDPTWDKKTGYRTRSVLCCPIIDTSTDECLGCLQIINKKDRYNRTDTPEAVFKGRDQELGRDFCSVIAIAVKNAASTRWHATATLYPSTAGCSIRLPASRRLAGT